MAVSRLKTWSDGEVLEASDLNAEFNNILDNGQDVGSPRTKAFEMAGWHLYLDSDKDTYWRANTDDQADLYVGGTLRLQVTASGIDCRSQNLLNVSDPTAAQHGASKAYVDGQAQGQGQYAADTGAANAYAIAPTPAITAYAAGLAYVVIPANNNTGASTLNVNAVGTRNIFYNGAALAGGEIQANVPMMVLDDGTQFNIIGSGFALPFSDANPMVVGSADATKKVRMEVDGLTTATTRVLTMPDADVDLQYARAASDSAAGALEIAVQSEVEAASSNTLAVPPGRMQYHPGMAKFWLKWPTSGTTITASYNVTSVTNTGVGKETVVIDTDFSSANWCPQGAATTNNSSDATAGRYVSFASQAAGSIALVIVSGTGPEAFADTTNCFVCGFGDQ